MKGQWYMKKQNLTILITGASLSVNYGAQAMALSLIYKLQKYNPHIRIFFSTPYVDLDRYMAGQLGIALIDRGSFGKYIENAFRIVCVKLLGVTKLANNYVRAYLSSDVILDISGDMLTDTYGYKVFFRKFKEFIIMNMLKKKVIILPQSMGPFHHFGTEAVAQFFLKKAEIVMPREKITQVVLQRLCLENISPIYPDLALSLQPFSDSEDVSHYAHLIAKSKKTVIGLSISGSITRYAGQRKKSNANEDQELFISKFATALQTIRNKYNVVFVFVPHVIGPTREDDDRIVSRKVARKINEQDCILVEDIEDSRKLKYLISCCDLFIGSRMHANIAALSSGVPTMSIAYSHKYLGIMEMFGLEKYVVDYTVLTQQILEETIIEFIENKAVLREMMQQKMNIVAQDIRRFDEMLIKEFTQG